MPSITHASMADIDINQGVTCSMICTVARKMPVFHVSITSYISYTLKKRRLLPNSQKKVQDIQKVSSCIQMPKKRLFGSVKTLKVLLLDTRADFSAAKPFVKFRTAEKRFRKIYKTFKVSYSSPMFWYEAIRV